MATLIGDLRAGTRGDFEIYLPSGSPLNLGDFRALAGWEDGNFNDEVSMIFSRHAAKRTRVRILTRTSHDRVRAQTVGPGLCIERVGSQGKARPSSGWV